MLFFFLLQFLPHALNESFIDFGTLGMGDKRTVVFAVINENPVDVSVSFSRFILMLLKHHIFVTIILSYFFLF